MLLKKYYNQDKIYLEAMNKLNLSIEDIIESSNSFNSGYKYFTRVYAFSTENLKEVDAPNINYINKSILGILGSGDHIINSIISGAKSYIGFDVSFLACFFTELKLAALKYLDYDEFINFYAREEWMPNEFVKEYSVPLPRENEGGAFSILSYKKIKSVLSDNAQNFFNNIMYKSFICNGQEVPYPFYFLARTLTKNELVKQVPYLFNIERYILTNKVDLNKILLFPENVISIPKNQKIINSAEYDIIYLSSVFYYITNLEDKKRIFKEYIQLLKSSGTIVMDFTVRPILKDKYNQDFIYFETAHRRFDIDKRKILVKKKN
jgi:hypothetical protein